MNIRPFQPGDTEQLKGLYKALYKDYQNAILPDELKRYEEFKDLEATIEYAISLEDSPEWKTFVAEMDDKRLIGFISGRIGELPYYKLDRFGMIESFFVKEEYQGQGIGKELYLHLERWFKEKGCKIAKAESWIFNHSAIEAYEGLGFKRLNLILVKDIDQGS